MKKIALAAAVLAGLCVAFPALAQLNSVQNLADDTFNLLDAIGPVVVAIAVIIAGFLILATQQSMRVIVGVLLGGLLIGAAVEIATFVTSV